jgi:peptidoglycan/LPS O-acetylase OafA/YrhL
MLFGLGMLWFQGALVAIHGRDLMERAWASRVARAWPLVFVAAVAWKTAHLPPQGLYLISGAAFTLMMLDFVRTRDVHPPRNAGRWRTRVVTTLGLSSYPMYLFHGPILMLAASMILRTHAIADWRVTWGLLMILGWASGAALGWVLEKPVMDWRSEWLRSLAGRPTQAIPPMHAAKPARAVEPQPEPVAG